MRTPVSHPAPLQVSTRSKRQASGSGRGTGGGEEGRESTRRRDRVEGGKGGGGADWSGRAGLVGLIGVAGRVFVSSGVQGNAGVGVHRCVKGAHRFPAEMGAPRFTALPSAHCIQHNRKGGAPAVRVCSCRRHCPGSDGFWHDEHGMLHNVCPVGSARPMQPPRKASPQCGCSGACAPAAK